MLRFFLLTLTLTTGLEASYILPKNVIPKSYKLEIFTYLGEKDNNFDFDGRVRIKTSCISPTYNITLNSKNLTIDEKHIKTKDVTTMTKLKNFKVLFQKTNDFLIISFDTPLKKNHEYQIDIIFKGKMDDSLVGFYRSSYTDNTTKEKKWLGVTQFKAISARTAFPCFDQPNFKTPFSISIARKEGLRAFSNMPLAVTKPVKTKPGYYWEQFETSSRMPTYLVAYGVSAFEYKESNHRDSSVTFRIWARKDFQNQVDLAKEVTPKVFEYYNNFFNINLSLQKLDMIAVPNFATGLTADLGLITYQESDLLFDPENDTVTDKYRVVKSIAKKLAHQWFGNLVTIEWWTALWICEGFANFMAGVATNYLFPHWNSLECATITNILSVLSFDSLRSSHPVSTSLADPSKIDKIFDNISYKKGKSLINMLRQFLDDKTLQKGVINCLREHSYSNANQDDLWDALTKVAHDQNTLPKTLTIKTIMDTWTRQTGYPVINVVRDYKTESAVITQKRFLKDTTYSTDDKNPCWWVPLSYSSKSNPNFQQTLPKFWLTCPDDKDEQKFNLSVKADEWLIFNNKLSALYIVNYDKKNWQLIIQALQNQGYEKINHLNRVQLINDAAMLAFVGKLKLETFFDLIKYLKTEIDYLPWYSAINTIEVIDSYLKRDSSYALLKTYMQKLISPIYEKFGNIRMPKNKINDTLDKIKMQQLISSTACKYDEEVCINYNLGLFKKFMGQCPNQPNPIPEDIRFVVYCQGLKYGNEKEWDFLWQLYTNSHVASEKSSILGSLGCTKEIWLLYRYLEWALDRTKIRNQDLTLAFSSVANTDVGYYVAKDFFYKNIKKLYNAIEPNYSELTELLDPIANNMSTEDDLKELEAFIGQHKDIFSKAEQGVKQAFEGIKINIQWQKRYGAEIKQILEKYV